MISISPIEASSAADPDDVPPVMVGVDPTDETHIDRPVVQDESEMTDEEKTFWEWFKKKMDKLKGWFGEIVKGDKDAEKDGKN